ncbi:DUF4129 domain-containing protein [Deinococcus soli (ex Cha et al. 2016)]|uniref:Uncharacterized protein n=2 Tax=Deinococcus soli (ex Cha et al. 2016) TaxID=1309411 RepID=A0ACC6KAV3_9DEIO|nr:DUF4129 domain-containing protein [Deinococcus soli (ex Cha et al. 2016)]MDR6216548.1 hypothetical protein [Deinococcus soli (ex Cha et al. 2016)]MDR6327369.1 hypothetical protein [Deinococcus soli (ex Cha et al. 2016)]MDR6749644.1 hypothetical protein [Deinococcus soli (ex Cha et al. 2016)]
MTDLTSPVPDDLAAPRTGPPLTAYGLALLPLGLAGLLPLWGVALLCGLFALGVRFPVWAQARVLGTQLIIGLSVAAQVPAALAQPRQLLVLAGTYLLLSLSGFALGAGAHALEDGRRRGLLALLPGLLAPQPGLILALAGGALARPARDARHAAQTAPGWWTWVAGGAVVAALLGTLLPMPRPDIAGAFTPPLTSAVRPDTAQQTPAPAVPSAPSSFGTGTSWLGVQLDVGVPLLPPELALGAGLMGLLAAAGVPQLRRRAGRPPHPSEVLMVAGLVLTGLLWVVSAILLNLGGRAPGSADSGAAPPPDEAARMAEATAGPASQVISVTWLGPLAQLLALAALLIVAAVLLANRRRTAAPVTVTPARDDQPTTSVPPAPLHRVRAAYRGALAALSEAGLGRAAHETPAGYAARLGAHHPPLADPLGTLTALYEPVRYGGQLTDEQAGQAEQAARVVLQIIPTLPPLDSADHKDLS